MCKKKINMIIVVCVVLVIAFVYVAEICASPIQEENVKKTEGVNDTETTAVTQSVSPDIVSDEKGILSKMYYSADAEVVEKKRGPRYVGFYSTIGGKKFNKYEYLDRFLESIETFEIPSYTLAEDFPQEHVKTLNDFLIFCASVIARGRVADTGVIYEHPLVKMRLELNNPVRYEDFLAAVPLSQYISFQSRYFDSHEILCDYYIRMFMYPSRNSFLVDNILEPLRHDLANGKYRGYRFKSDNLPQFIREFADNCYIRRSEVMRRDAVSGLNGITIPPITLILPEEFYLLNYYAQTFLLMHSGELSEAYKELYKYKMPRTPYSPILPSVRYNPFGSGITRSYEYRLIPPRPYYYYSDDDRYHWFEYLQAELRSTGHSDYADSILETEIEHYRELTVWQLQLRAYLVEKLYEYGDSSNLSTLKELLTSEYETLKNAPEFQALFENAIEALRYMDDNVQATSAKGEIILPWIDREAIDNKQGIESEVLSIQQNPITWKIAIEKIDDEMKKEMKNLYEKAIYCKRNLAVISQRLNQENDLYTMVQLHSKLVSNTNVNCTPTGIFYQDFSSVINTNKYNADISETELSPQAKIDQRRYDLIVNDFWGHYSRRRNGDMTVGEIILPWVEVQDK